VITADELFDYFIFSPVSVTRAGRHPYQLFVPHTSVNTRKHYFYVGLRVIEPWYNLNVLRSISVHKDDSNVF